MSVWKYTDATNTVVSRTNDDGSMESCLVSVIADWLALGNTPEPYVPPTPPVPQAVSRFQARAALHLAGLLVQVEAIMADPATDMLTKLAWQDAQEFRRDSPTLKALAATLGLNDAALDNLFTQAATLTA